MTEKAPKQDSLQLSGRRKVLFVILTPALAIVVALVLAEVLLRVLPIPGINYHNFYYDEWTGGHLYPNSHVLYRGGGKTVRRDVNSLGYLDSEHAVAKPPGVTRIGFFGDSYTEARQVALGDTFIRVAQDRLNAAGDQRFETLSFGLSGYGTVQSYLESTRWADSLNLDLVVYVFCENDMADQIPQITPSHEVPHPYLTSTSFDVDFSFRDRYAYKTSRLHRSLQYFKSRSLLVSTLTARLKLLKKHGVKMTVTEDDMVNEGGAPRKDGHRRIMSAPSTWPDTLLTYGRELETRIITRWRDELQHQDKRLLVLIVPRTREMNKPLAEQDTWGKWLTALCAAEDIEVIDPSPGLIEIAAQGTPPFRDHFTAAGHRVVAETFAKHILRSEAGQKR